MPFGFVLASLAVGVAAATCSGGFDGSFLGRNSSVSPYAAPA
jgi:hypothetical protein